MKNHASVMCAAGLCVVFASAPARAQTLRVPPRSLFAPPENVGLLATARAALRDAQAKQLLALKSEPAKPRVVCGMTVIPGDSKIDARILRPVPDGDGSKFTLQFITPPACQRQ